MPRPLVLDFDNSVKPLPDAHVIALGDWQEAIRFGCRKKTLIDFGQEIATAIDPHPGLVFLGSGDYHHISYLLIERLRKLNTRIQVVVFDNHPDNMRYPFGIHCGSWVWHVSRMPFIARIHVVGITSTDVEAGQIWENHLAPLFFGKVVYWCVQRNLRALQLLGIRHSRSFPSVAALIDDFVTALGTTPEPVYLSIDKDVLAPAEVQTNWDQGIMRLEELTGVIQRLRGRILASDVVGEVSSYRYRSLFKRFLSGLDRQPTIPEQTLTERQIQHQRVNRALISALFP
jgi:arginase family enzyme